MPFLRKQLKPDLPLTILLVSGPTILRFNMSDMSDVTCAILWRHVGDEKMFESDQQTFAFSWLL